MRPAAIRSAPAILLATTIVTASAIVIATAIVSATAIVTAAAVVPAVAFGLPDRGQAPQSVFRAGVDAVAVDVSVRDGRRAIAGLTAADFEVLDNGVPQQVTDVSYGRLPVDVTVALDTSLSVTGDALTRLRRAILQLMADLGPEDRLKLTTFNMRITRVVGLSNEPGAVEAALRAVQTGGGSSIWDAAGVALVAAGAAGTDRRQLVVLFTDGADSASTLTPDAVLDVARRTNAALTTVVAEAVRVPDALFSMRQMLDDRTRSRIFGRLAEETGGAVLTVGGDMTGTFRRALEEFRASYVLHFSPVGVARPGFHTLEVRVPGRRGADVRARRGYFGG
ncbi:MAG: VWA domain-containing protein [Vicinamibacterales bacterium]